MKVLVTGGAGFVGSHVVDRLVAADHEVSVVDDLRGGKVGNVNPKAVLSMAAVCDIPRIYFDAVVHCAATADISTNWEHFNNRIELYENNIGTTAALLEACGVGRIGSFVFISTAAVYGDGAHGRNQPSDAVRPLSPYAASKVAGEALVQAYAHRFGWGWSVARLVSCVGSRYAHGHVADFVRMAKDDGVIRAKDNGTQRKSYVHVLDAADRIARMAEFPQRVCNVSSDQTWSVRDTIAEMGIHRPVQVQWADQEAGWVGDPVNLAVSGGMNRIVGDGVQDALRSLGWAS